MDKIQFWTLIDRFRNSPDPESAARDGILELPTHFHKAAKSTLLRAGVLM